MTQHERVQSPDDLLERKKRLSKRHAANGVANGLVEIPGPLSPETRDEIIRIARKREAVEHERRPDARILKISPFAEGLAIETEDEKLAHQIGTSITRSRKAKMTTVFDDAGKRRIVTCILPETR